MPGGARSGAIVARQESLGPLQELDGGGQVAPSEGAAARRVEPTGGLGAEGALARPDAPELSPILVGLLQVVADDLLLLAERLLGRSIEPEGEPLVQLAPRLLGQER